MALLFDSVDAASAELIVGGKTGEDVSNDA